METEIKNNRRKGHVARLPKVLRDKVNTMLDDGATYPEIVAELKNSTNPPLPHSVNEDNIGNWQKGGYQDYLRNRDWNDRLLQRQEKFLETTGNDPVKLAEAGMQIAATGLCELLDELSRVATDDEKASDRYARIVNAMTRLARVILTYTQHRDALAKEKASELKQLDPKREFGEEETLAIVDQVNKLIGLRQYRKNRIPEAAPATPSSLSEAEVPRAMTPQSSSYQISNFKSEIGTNSADPSGSEISNLKSDIPPHQPTAQTGTT